MALNIQDILSLVQKMAKVFMIGKMGLPMMEIGRIIK